VLPDRKLLIVSAAFPPLESGEAQHAFLLTRELLRRGFDVDVLSTVGVARDPSIRVWPLMSDWSWRELPLFTRFLRSSSPDVILLVYIGWIYKHHPMITYAPTIARLVAPRARFVTQFENALGARAELYGLPGRLRARAAATAAGIWTRNDRFGTLVRDSHRLIVLSEYHRQLLTGRSARARAKSVLIPPPPLMELSPDTREARRRGREMLGADDEHFLMVYLGYLYPRKGLETLLRAFAIVAQGKANARLAVIGGPLEGHEDYAAAIQDVAADLGIGDKVRWAGSYAWDSADGSFMLRAADAFVMPIDIGVALNNSSVGAAAAHGIPVVATRGKITEPAFRDRENVLLCPPKDPAAMAAALITVMDDDDLRGHLARGARALADKWFSWKRAVDRTIAAFDD
jgi:glycosyltransferase involved in cell wall biosynthesis